MMGVSTRGAGHGCHGVSTALPAHPPACVTVWGHGRALRRVTGQGSAPGRRMLGVSEGRRMLGGLKGRRMLGRSEGRRTLGAPHRDQRPRHNSPAESEQSPAARSDPRGAPAATRTALGHAPRHPRLQHQHREQCHKQDPISALQPRDSGDPQTPATTRRTAPQGRIAGRMGADPSLGTASPATAPRVPRPGTLQPGPPPTPGPQTTFEEGHIMSPALGGTMPGEPRGCWSPARVLQGSPACSREGRQGVGSPLLARLAQKKTPRRGAFLTLPR